VRAAACAAPSSAPALAPFTLADESAPRVSKSLGFIKQTGNATASNEAPDLSRQQWLGAVGTMRLLVPEHRGENALDLEQS
jgi:hypothetical protein